MSDGVFIYCDEHDKQTCPECDEDMADLERRATAAESLLRRHREALDVALSVIGRADRAMLLAERGPWRYGEFRSEVQTAIEAILAVTSTGHPFADCIKADGDKPCDDCTAYAMESVGAPQTTGGSPGAPPTPAPRHECPSCDLDDSVQIPPGKLLKSTPIARPTPAPLPRDHYIREALEEIGTEVIPSPEARTTAAEWAVIVSQSLPRAATVAQEEAPATCRVWCGLRVDSFGLGLPVKWFSGYNAAEGRSFAFCTLNCRTAALPTPGTPVGGEK